MIKRISLKTLRKRYRDFLRFSFFLLPYWKMKLSIIALSSLLVPLGLVMPYLTKLMIDGAYANKDLALFIRLVIIGAIVFIFTAIISGLNSYLEEKLRLKVDFDINSKVFKHLQNLSLGFFQNKSTGEHIYRISFDLGQVTNLITGTLPQSILLIPRFLLILAIVFYLNWKMALLCVVLSPILYLQPYYFIRKRRDILQKQIECSESIFVRLEEVFRNIHLVKAFGREDFEIQDFLKRLFKRIDLFLKDIRMGLYSTFTGNGSRKFVLGLISVYGGYQIIKGQMSLGSLTAIMLYFNQLISLQNSIGDFFQQIAFDFVSCDRVLEILDRQPDIMDRPNAGTIKLFDADIEFKNVTFGYQEGIPVLKNLSLSIKSGLWIALVGYSGCGKTTLLNLLLRLYEPQKGSILIGGFDIKDIKMDYLKNQIGIALQEPFLWYDTVENNIRYGKENASFDEIVEVTQKVGADNFIQKLPNGYKTNLGENASLISQGQKQRIAIARAIIKKPTILILDEAMSSLDSASEDGIIRNIKRERVNQTTIIVSHRLSTVKKMDLLYFLEGCDKIEIGKHEELLEINPKYRELFSSQIELENLKV